ncbi:hypothetical protein RUM43_003924, partial [Polyplax serrata]
FLLSSYGPRELETDGEKRCVPGASSTCNFVRVLEGKKIRQEVWSEDLCVGLVHVGSKDFHLLDSLPDYFSFVWTV